MAAINEIPVELICSELWGGIGAVITPVTIPGMRGAVVSIPSQGGRGGDVYYLSSCSAGVMARVCLADVAGHGESVSTISTWLHEILRKHMSIQDPSAVFSEINGRVYARGHGALTTATCFSYEALNGEIRYCYAGHPPAYHYAAAEKTWRPLTLTAQDGDNPADRPFGAAENPGYTVADGRLAAGDRIFLYSDGVLEATSDGGEMFGEERLHTFLGSKAHLPVYDLAMELMNALTAFSATPNGLSHDDVTFMFLESKGLVRGMLPWLMLKNMVRKALRGKPTRPEPSEAV